MLVTNYSVKKKKKKDIQITKTSPNFRTKTHTYKQGEQEVKKINENYLIYLLLYTIMKKGVIITKGLREGGWEV